MLPNHNTVYYLQTTWWKKIRHVIIPVLRKIFSVEFNAKICNKSLGAGLYLNDFSDRAILLHLSRLIFNPTNTTYADGIVYNLTLQFVLGFASQRYNNNIHAKDWPSVKSRRKSLAMPYIKICSTHANYDLRYRVCACAYENMSFDLAHLDSGHTSNGHRLPPSILSKNNVSSNV